MDIPEEELLSALKKLQHHWCCYWKEFFNIENVAIGEKIFSTSLMLLL
jgi:hypothetical protein